MKHLFEEHGRTLPAEAPAWCTHLVQRAVHFLCGALNWRRRGLLWFGFVISTFFENGIRQLKDVDREVGPLVTKLNLIASYDTFFAGHQFPVQDRSIPTLGIPNDHIAVRLQEKLRMHARN